MLTASNSSSSNVSTVDVAWREGGGGAFAFSFDFAFVFALTWTTIEPCRFESERSFLGANRKVLRVGKRCRLWGEMMEGKGGRREWEEEEEEVAIENS